MQNQIDYADFERVDIRVGTMVDARPFPEARKPAFKLTIDFGPEVGVKSPVPSLRFTTSRTSSSAVRSAPW